MRATDFMIREEITSTANSTVDESKNPLVGPRTGGLPVEDDKNHLVDLVRDVDIVTRQRNMDRAPTLQGGMRTGEGR